MRTFGIVWLQWQASDSQADRSVMRERIAELVIVMLSGYGQAKNA
jgi:hypothetical protein